MTALNLLLFALAAVTGTFSIVAGMIFESNSKGTAARIAMALMLISISLAFAAGKA